MRITIQQRPAKLSQKILDARAKPVCSIYVLTPVPLYLQRSRLYIAEHEVADGKLLVAQVRSKITANKCEIRLVQVSAGVLVHRYQARSV